jgi:hypothetical protein
VNNPTNHLLAELAEDQSTGELAGIYDESSPTSKITPGLFVGLVVETTAAVRTKIPVSVVHDLSPRIMGFHSVGEAQVRRISGLIANAAPAS